MDMALKAKFTAVWSRYFTDAELPLTFYYADTEGQAELVKPGSVHRCLIAALGEVRKGRSLAFNVDSIGCPGGKKYAGFIESIRPEFEYFLSCGIPGKVVGERYKKTPEIVKESMKLAPAFKAPAPLIVFKRWDHLDESDSPSVAVFHATPDVLSGLFTLANYEEAEANGVVAPFGSGCSTIIQYPYLEKDAARPRGVIGLFDVSARPHIPAGTVGFSVPINKLTRMIDNAEESFLITNSWAVVQKRINAAP